MDYRSLDESRISSCLFYVSLWRWRLIGAVLTLAQRQQATLCCFALVSIYSRHSGPKVAYYAVN